jgi:hypothetical protein
MREFLFAGDSGIGPKIDDHDLALLARDELCEFVVFGRLQIDFVVGGCSRGCAKQADQAERNE